MLSKKFILIFISVFKSKSGKTTDKNKLYILFKKIDNIDMSNVGHSISYHRADESDENNIQLNQNTFSEGSDSRPVGFIYRLWSNSVNLLRRYFVVVKTFFANIWERIKKIFIGDIGSQDNEQEADVSERRENSDTLINRIKNYFNTIRHFPIYFKVIKCFLPTIINTIFYLYIRNNAAIFASSNDMVGFLNKFSEFTFIIKKFEWTIFGILLIVVIACGVRKFNKRIPECMFYIWIICFVFDSIFYLFFGAQNLFVYFNSEDSNIEISN